MNQRKLSVFILIMLLSIVSEAQTYKVSENKRYLLKNNEPFMWIGDTAWELFHRLNRAESEYYLKRRAEQGFTVVQAVVLAEFDGLVEKNPYGDIPFTNQDPSKPNEAYFKHVDYIVDKAAELNITIAMLPTWGDKLFKAAWGKGPEIFNVDNAYTYGKYIGQRYANRKNIIWVLGGDRNPRKDTQDGAVWRSMAKGVGEACGGQSNILMTFHPQPNQEGASEFFHEEEWFDFNMFQTGHCRDNDVASKISGSYNRKTIKPVIDGEPIYEDHPVCFNAKDLGTSNAYDLRKFAYVDMFAGAFGHTYGCHDIWQMYSPSREAVNGPNMYWQQAMELPGANQVKHLRKLIESRPFLERVPDQSLIVENNLSTYERIQATRGLSYAFIYSALGKPFTVNMGKITGASLSALWYSPKTGESQDAGTHENKGAKLFSPPSMGQSHDWVLILDDVSKKYKKP
jgi:hypothetical protein